ncbi:MAG: T9SS type A sorting domain-containing protein [Bacteroidota bacterium]
MGSILMASKPLTPIESCTLDLHPVVSEVSEPGKVDGSISLAPTGGLAPYQYQWSHDATLLSPTASSLPTGEYTVTVTDASACQVIETYTVLEPLACEGSFFQLVRNTVNRTMDVYVASVTSGGFSPSFLFSINYKAQALDALGFNQADGYIYGLGKGNKHLIKIGAAGIGKDLGPLAGIDLSLNYTSAVCNGSDYYLYGNGNPGALYKVAIGSLSVTTLNGAISMGKDIGYLTDGTRSFIVTVRDGRLGRYNIGTPSSSAILPVVSVGANPLNNDNEFTSLWVDDDRSIFVYNSNSGQGHRIVNIGGTFYSFDLGSFGYTIPLTDGMSCLDGGPAVPCQIKIAVQSLVCDDGSGTGSIDIKATSGTIGSTVLQYHWSNGATTRDITALASGTYSVTVFDDFGCFETLDIVVPVCSASKTKPAIQALDFSAVQIFPNPTKSRFELRIPSTQAEQVDIRLSDVNGRLVFSRKEQLVDGNNAIQFTLNGLQSGIYFVQLKRASGLAQTKRLIVLR